MIYLTLIYHDPTCLPSARYGHTWVHTVLCLYTSFFPWDKRYYIDQIASITPCLGSKGTRVTISRALYWENHFYLQVIFSAAQIYPLTALDRGRHGYGGMKQYQSYSIILIHAWVKVYMRNATGKHEKVQSCLNNQRLDYTLEKTSFACDRKNKQLTHLILLLQAMSEQQKGTCKEHVRKLFWTFWG